MDDYFTIVSSKEAKIEDARIKLMEKYHYIFTSQNSFINKELDIVILPLTLNKLHFEDILYEFLTVCKTFKNYHYEITDYVTAFVVDENTCIVFNTFSTFEPCKNIIKNIYNKSLYSGTKEKFLTKRHIICWAFAEQLGTTVDNYEKLAEEIEF